MHPELPASLASELGVGQQPVVAVEEPDHLLVVPQSLDVAFELRSERLLRRLCLRG